MHISGPVISKDTISMFGADEINAVTASIVDASNVVSDSTNTSSLLVATVTSYVRPLMNIQMLE